MAQINKPTDYFNTVLYTGNGGTQSVTGFGHAPDLIWTKERNNDKDHAWYDSVRGANQLLESNKTGSTNNTTAGISSFDSDGFTTGDFFQTNDSGDSYVSWGWLAGGTASSNTDGSITSSVSANTTSGFSIVSYTANGTAGATIGHGLGAVPQVVLTKDRDAASNWFMYHVGTDASAPETKYMELESTDAVQDFTVWNDTAPTSSVFTIGNASGNNTSGNDIIAYCFAEKKGFSKFGSYTGNGSSDGTFVYTGFKPAWVMFKEITDGTAGDNWFIYDNKRNEFNQTQKNLRANLSAAEADSSAVAIDILSNGYKLRTNDDSLNGSGDSYIYMAFASEPIVGTNNIPATAR